MRLLTAILISAALTSCSGVRGVEYSTLNMQAIPKDRTVSLDVVLPEGETDEFWQTTERKLYSKLALELEEGKIFKRILNTGEPADYRLVVTIADLTIDRPDVGTESAGTDKLTQAVSALANVAGAFAAAKIPDQVREIKVYTTLEEQGNARRVLAFRAEGADARTDSTVTAIIERIVAGVSCHGDDCA